MLGSGAGFHEAAAQCDRQGRSLGDFWTSPEATASSAFEEDPTRRQTGKSSGEPAHVERLFGLVRQKRARHVRRTRAAFGSERTGHLATKLLVEWHNKAVT
ncbi:MAG: hypothetical protein BRD25_02235 [Bacteroidetes bacterium QH_1_61_8]|nr:MAG: hypothetical protein BRD25_02235 [Bacteroidetes bacterium QH_1_61_8]